MYKGRDKPTPFTPKQKVSDKKHVRKKLGEKLNPPTQLTDVDLVRKTVATTSQPKVYMGNLRNKYSFDT